MSACEPYVEVTDNKPIPELTAEQKANCPVGNLTGEALRDLTNERYVSAACRRKYARLVEHYENLRTGGPT